MRILTLAMALVGLISSCAFQQPAEPYRAPGTLYSPDYSGTQERERAAAQAPERNFFCPGDTKAVVERVQGTPTSISGADPYQTWFYGADQVQFREGKVYNHTNFGGRLKVRIFSTPPMEGASSEQASSLAYNFANRDTGVGDEQYTDGTERGNNPELAPQSVPVPTTTGYIPQEVDPNPIAILLALPTDYSPSVRALPKASSYREVSTTKGLPKIFPVSGYSRKDGTNVRLHYRSRC
jgi:hypothetical protein